MKWVATLLFCASTALGQSAGAVFFQTAYSSSPTVATPTFSPTSPYSGAGTTVTISDGTSGAAIVYCTDTTNTCTPSTAGTSVVVSVTGYIRAKATKAAYNASAIASWQGTISGGCTAVCDAFAGVIGTLLATHDSHWVSFDDSYPVTNIQITGTAATVVSTGTAGALYNGSSSETSYISIPANQYHNYSPVAIIHGTTQAGSTQVGYIAVYQSSDATHYDYVTMYRNGSQVAQVSTLTGLLSAPHTLALVATGTSPKTLTVYVDGVSKLTYSDNSPLSGGYPGFAIAGTGYAGTSNISVWQDHQ